MTSELDKPGVENQYKLLSILDGKATGLLTFNAMFLATLAIWLESIPANVFHLILDIVFIAILSSSFLILQVIWLEWALTDERAQQLEGIRDVRTAKFQRAWRISKWSVVAVIAVSSIHTVGTLVHTVNACVGNCAWFFGPDIFGGVR